MNWKRKTITALCAGALCASVVGGTLLTAGAEAVDFAKDSTKWQATSGIVFGEDATYLTGNSSYAASQKIGGNSTIELNMTGNFANWQAYGWGGNYILFKNTNDTVETSWNQTMAASSGNWLAFYMGTGYSVTFAECTDGVVETKSTNGVVDVCSTTSNWKITTTDTATGVDVVVAFTTTGGITKNITYSSNNTKLWGEYTFTVGHYGGGTCSETTGYTYNSINVTDVDSSYTKQEEVVYNYATDASNWHVEGSTNPSNITVGSSGVVIGNSGAETAALFSGNVVKDSKVSLVIDGNAPTQSWGNIFVVFKNTSGTIDASPLAVENVINGTTGEGNWMALALGNSWNAWLIECNNGVLTKVDLISWVNGACPSWISPQPIDGGDFWSVRKHVSEISITTTDTDTGVDVSITYKASGSPGEVVGGNTYYNTERTYAITYSSTNTALHGDYAMSVGYYGGAGAGENITLSSLNITKAYTAELGGASLSMEGDVGVNMYTAVSNVAIANNASVNFQMDGETFATTKVNTNDYTTKDGVKYYKLSCNVAPKDYQKAITATMTLGSKTYTIAENFTIASYIEAMKDDATAGAAATALGAYCEAARAYFAGETVAESTQDVSAIADNAVDVTGAPESCTIKGVSLLLDSNVTLRLYVTASEMPTESVTVAGEAASWTKIEGKNQYYVEITDIAAKDLGVEYTFVIGECTVVCNALDYVNMAVNVSTDANLVNLVKTLYTYHLAAYAYANA